MPSGTVGNPALQVPRPTRRKAPVGMRLALHEETKESEQLDRPERRNAASREAALRRVWLEYGEMPGLRLTLAQACRLFDLPGDVCARILEGLVDAGYLGRDENCAYLRYDVW